MKIQVRITNLGNGKHTHKNTSSLNDIGNLQEEVNSLGMNDTEIQPTDSYINLSYRKPVEFLKLLEELKINFNDLIVLIRISTIG